MRRMNYNPFETPFASGKVDVNNKCFILDKDLEEGFYILLIYSFADDEYLPAFMIISSDVNISSSSSVIHPLAYQNTGVLEFSGNIKNKINIKYENDLDPFILEDSTINVYKIS